MGTTGGAVISAQLWVVVTALLLLAKFVVGSVGPWFFSTRRIIVHVACLLHALNYYSVSYTLGLMSPSSDVKEQGRARVEDFFQVWAVLVVTMQESVRIGRPYRPIEMTLVDLLSSLWAADQLQVHTELHLKVPLWLIWSIHAFRVIWFYVSSNRATEKSLDNIKLVSDYMMTSQHTDDEANPGSMLGYRYIVVGEEEQLIGASSPDFTLEMDLTGPKASELVTVEKVWQQARRQDDSNSGNRLLLSTAADSDNRFKDVCLSYALYKLQRRRFYDFPIAEATHRATSRLVLGILQSGGDGNYERALRIAEVETSFLHDFLYSRHAVVFSGGFPLVRLVLSLLMMGAALYLPHAVGHIPGTGTVVTGRRNKVVRITHGHLVTYLVIGIIVCQELAELSIYVLSQWTKVWIICSYINLEGCRGRIRAAWRLMMEIAARIMFQVIWRGHWGQQIRQYNLLTTAFRNKGRRWIIPIPSIILELTHFSTPIIIRKVKLQGEAKAVLFQSLEALIDSLQRLFQENEDSPLPRPKPSAEDMNSLLMSYSSKAFPLPTPPGPSHSQVPVIEGPMVSKLEGETHKILVWHIATSLCQIQLLEEAAGSVVDLYTLQQPTARGNLVAAWPHYVAAVSLSNYCAYLVTQALVPDNGLVVDKVFNAVFDEVRVALRGCSTMAEIRNKLIVVTPDNGTGTGATTTIVGMAAELSRKLESMYQRDDDRWERLAKLWAGFLLHLSASTRAAKHKIHLQGRGELTTHLWVLLSHAGFLGNTSHGEQLLDPEDRNGA